jgi:Rps23 Pro-64 3,4-dihydroxylase Tpa1-like proline 4-hydroxylase
MTMSDTPQPFYKRDAIAAAIAARCQTATVSDARASYAKSGSIPYFVIDDLLPSEMAQTIYRAFPRPSDMFERRSWREHKYVAAQMNRFDPQAEEALFAFHDPRVVELVARVTQLPELEADPRLYAGGISLMTEGNFLNPHLDNSHNNDRTRYRVLNLLYYVSPEWKTADGGHLELWPNGVKQTPLAVPNVFNRLVVMSTGPGSWHSVGAIRGAAPRCCVSNYYFSRLPLGGREYFRVTRFRGRPEQPFRDVFLRLDGQIRQAMRTIRPQGVVATRHIYNKESSGK